MKKNNNMYTSQGVLNLNHLQPRRENLNRKDVLKGICGKDHKIETKTLREDWGDKILTFCTVCSNVFFTDYIDK